MRSLFIVAPNLILCLGSIFVLLAGLWIQSNGFLVASTIVSLASAALVFFSMAGKAPQDAFGGLIAFDGLGLFFAIFSILATLLCVVLSARSTEIKSDRRAEYYSILLALVTGLVFMGMSTHFLMIYLAVETVSILSYTLAGFNRERRDSVEASMKYVVYGSMASALMVFGMSLLYGVTGSLDLMGIREYLSTTAGDQIPAMLWVATALVFAGIGYKVSAAPMHMWTPDVYEGAPTPVSALFSVAPKAAGLALLLRFFITGYSVPVEGAADSSYQSLQVIGNFGWPQFLMVSSVFTMFMGNLAALGQVSVKRILAYSSIAHAGYMLMGATTQTDLGVTSIAFYVLIYCLMNVGAFWVASKVEDSFGGDDLRHFRGLIYSRPFYAVVMAVFLFSLVGLPPFAGFIGKLYLFQAVLAREMYGFALFAAINSVISLYYYVKIIKAMFLEQPELRLPEGKTPFDSRAAMVFLTLLAVPNVVLGLYWEPVMKLASMATSIFVGK